MLGHTGLRDTDRWGGVRTERPPQRRRVWYEEKRDYLRVDFSLAIYVQR